MSLEEEYVPKTGGCRNLCDKDPRCHEKHGAGAAIYSKGLVYCSTCAYRIRTTERVCFCCRYKYRTRPVDSKHKQGLKYID